MKRGLTEQDVAIVAAYARVCVATVRRALSSSGRKTRSRVTVDAIVTALRGLGFKAEAARLHRDAERKRKVRR